MGKVFSDKEDTVVPWQYIGSSKNPALITDSKEWMKTGEVVCFKQEILFQSTTCTKQELSEKELYYIREHDAANPEKGYNLKGKRK